ncbi:methyltransferase, FkbM family [Bacteroidales bacterium Barb7]|nr:methyltransferase, FkbM family [Bacteroidales bacterium Barb7]
MKLYQNVMFGLRYKQWTYLEAFAYFLKGVTRELNIAPSVFLKYYENISSKAFKKKWLMKNNDESYFDFKGAKIPNISDNPQIFTELRSVFEDTFMFPCLFKDNYNKSVVEFMDQRMGEGPYGYTDGSFDVTVKQNDVVIDAGAWIGDFSAYAVSKGAIAYAFEPVEGTFQLLHQTIELNNGEIYPVQIGLADRECEINISVNGCYFGNSIFIERENSIKEKISITTLDKFVKENNIEKVDFIKADIEGAERDMLRGATNVLKTFAPKLAICTYHLPDDPEVLEKIILEANPDYKVVHLRHKLFAAVVK